MPASSDSRVVIVTGAGGKGCGRAIAVRFAATGAVVVVGDIDDAGGRETVATIERARGRAAYCHADVRSQDDSRALVEFAESTFGGVNVLVNNASALTDRPDIEDWGDVLETDLLGAIHMTRWAIDAMRRSGGGAIVNIASISALWHGRRTPGGFAGYDVAKAGMIRMTTRLASLAEADGIRVNCLAPGWIATDGPRQYWESLTPEERAERGVPARLLSRDEIARAVERLADDRTLAGRVLVWWPDAAPALIPWGDRGYRDLDAIDLT
ncbi:MAG TPA: SDR family oxidoreductase [Vicinamibacterales bacterium]|nr:SDR family oxidoreductase [Vicinamibacterales bacterium]